MENPLRIPMTCLSSECGKLEGQIPWTAFSHYKFRNYKSQPKNGSVMFDHYHAEMDRKKPLLILPDVLKTEQGMAYMERIKNSRTMATGGQVSSAQEESGQWKEEEPVTRRETRSCQKEAKNNGNQSATPKRKQRITRSSSQGSKVRRRRQTSDDDEDEENKDIEEVIIGKDNGEDDKFAEVVDCGLSVSWEPSVDSASYTEFSPASIKDRWTDPERGVQHSSKRKRKDSGSQCNGTSSPKRHRESVLRLSGEKRSDGPPAPAHFCQEESVDDADLESLDLGIVQFTVGEDDRTDILVPIISPSLEVTDFTGSPRRSSLPGEDCTAENTSDPIVLSSDEEESGAVSQRCSRGVRTVVAVDDAVIQGESLQESVTTQQEASDIRDMQVLEVVVDEVSHSVTVPPTPSMDFSCMVVGFLSLHCGGYCGKSNGGIMIEKHKIVIPLKDTTGRLETILTFERKELRRYSIWEQQELVERGLRFDGDEESPPPAAVLLFCVSATAAAAVQQELCQLCVKQDGATNAGKASPFILVTLREPLEGMEGALIRSVLDIDCLNSLAHECSLGMLGAEGESDLKDFLSPVLSMDECVELIRKSKLDSHLLALLGENSTDPGLNVHQDSSHSDVDESPTPTILLEVDLQKESVLESEPEPVPEQDTGTQIEPKEDQTEQELTHPSEEKKKEPAPAYTLCHRRTKGSYSVSLCKPDSSWTKYKHQGLAHRLIQFPPPPLKGGITVTMEDLQCLDSGQFLNDVIIDFYLKYLLQNASSAVAERSHIFSSFFFKQLTRRDNASEGGSNDFCQRQRRHQRVKTWTRHVDIFKKDFLFVPVNQEAHWYLVVICFPGLDEPKLEDWTGPDSQTGKSRCRNGKSQGQDEVQGCKSSDDKAETSPTLNRGEPVDAQPENAQRESTKDPPPSPTPGPVNCTELTCQRTTVCRRPCILIMDSLKLSLHERVFKLLREYLQSEWEVRRGSSRDFDPEQMKNSHCQVPLQDNSSDCGLYLLQYVECFLKDPVVHFDLPLCLQRWFPRQQVRRKRDEIRDLILNLYRHQNLDNRHTKQPCC